jgi:VWFA-related protein
LRARSPASLVDQTMNADSGGQLSADTGGEANYSTNDLTKAIAQAIQNGAHCYTLVYTPTNTKMDGKFRHIYVKPIQGKSKLAYGRGYYADNGAAPESA